MARHLLAANRNLTTVYVLKDQLKHTWTYRRPAWAKRALDQWCALAEASGLRALQTFAKNLRRHAEGSSIIAATHFTPGDTKGSTTRPK